MPSIDPYCSNRVVRLIGVRDPAGQDEALIRCMAQQRVARSRVAGPSVAARGKKLVAEPFQPNERALAFNSLERIEELACRRLEIEHVGFSVRIERIRFTPVFLSS